MLQIIHLALLGSWGPICNLTAAKHFIWSPCAQKTSRVYSRLAWKTCRVWHYEAVFTFPLNLFELTLNQTWPGVPTSPKSFRSQSIRIDNLQCGVLRWLWAQALLATPPWRPRWGKNYINCIRYLQSKNVNVYIFTCPFFLNMRIISVNVQVKVFQWGFFSPHWKSAGSICKCFTSEYLYLNE